MASRRLAFGLLLSLCLLAAPATPLAAQPALDPRSLVGEWTGTWTAGATGGGTGSRAGTQGPYTLAISRVDGGRVFGTIQTRWYSGNIRGTLEDNRLIVASEQYRTELTVDGNQMRGTRQGGGIPPVGIQLVKKK
jgi:hypothetical protein